MPLRCEGEPRHPDGVKSATASLWHDVALALGLGLSAFGLFLQVVSLRREVSGIGVGFVDFLTDGDQVFLNLVEVVVELPRNLAREGLEVEFGEKAFAGAFGFIVVAAEGRAGKGMEDVVDLANTVADGTWGRRS